LGAVAVLELGLGGRGLESAESVELALTLLDQLIERLDAELAGRDIELRVQGRELVVASRAWLIEQVQRIPGDHRPAAPRQPARMISSGSLSSSRRPSSAPLTRALLT